MNWVVFELGGTPCSRNSLVSTLKASILLKTLSPVLEGVKVASTGLSCEDGISNQCSKASISTLAADRKDSWVSQVIVKGVDFSLLPCTLPTRLLSLDVDVSEHYQVKDRKRHVRLQGQASLEVVR